MCICSSGNLEKISQYFIFYTSALRNDIFSTTDSQSCKGIVKIHKGKKLFHLEEWNFFHTLRSSTQGTCKGPWLSLCVIGRGDRNLLSQFAFTSNCSDWENSINKSGPRCLPWRRESLLKWLWKSPREKLFCLFTFYLYDFSMNFVYVQRISQNLPK